MGRITISISDELLQRLRNTASERRLSLAALVLEALEEKIRNHRPRPRSLGAGSSGHTDTACRVGDERAEPRSWR